MNTRHHIAAVLVTITSLTVGGSIFATAAKTSAAKSQEKARQSAQAKIKRGEYIVRTSGCHDCHTPFKMGPHGPEPDMTRALSGHPQDLVMPAPPKLGDGPWVWAGSATNTAYAGPWGVSYAMNLTPDRVTGIGIWDEAMFIRTIRTGRHWGVSRPILPPMPWQVYRNMTDEDLGAIYAYLRTVKPIRNQIPDAVIATPPVQTAAR